MNTFSAAAFEQKGKILFGYSDIAIGIGERLGQFLDVKESDLPTLRAINPDGMKKYECETPVEQLTSKDI
jgi:hypothetical protein